MSLLLFLAAAITPNVVVSENNVSVSQYPVAPISIITPGAADPKATKQMICTVGYSAKVRNVSASTKKKVYASYNITPKPYAFEVDHLISLELGGSNDIKNLWPQSYNTQPWNARKKDVLENKLHKLVCNGQIELTEAQIAISHDWIRSYQVYVGNK